MLHSFTHDGLNISLDVESGSVHILSDAAMSYLQRYGNILPDSPPQGEESGLLRVYEELSEAKKQGTMFSECENYPMPDAIPNVKALCLNISHDCNLRCRYCFADGGDYSGVRELMTAETGKKALDFLCDMSGARRNLEVDFFGGEPMMNYEAVKEITLYGRELEKTRGKNIRFTMTTNGTLLDDESIEFLNREMHNVVLSLDGRRDVNDKNRPYADGTGCYNDVLPKYKKLVAARRDKSWYIRGTFTRENLDFCSDVLALADEGFTNISIEPVSLPDEHPLSIRECDLPKIYDEYDKLADAMLEYEKAGNGFTFFHFNVDLDAGPCVYKRMKGCGAGCEYLAVSPSGKLFPCHQFADEPDFSVGDLENGITATDIRKKLYANSIVNKPECRDCFAKYFCGGGCAAGNHKRCGDISINYKIACALERKRLECALYLSARRAERAIDS
jgi:uncharacterized protein